MTIINNIKDNFMENTTYSYLKSFNENIQDIPHQKHNVIGWKVKTEADAHLGETVDLLYDTQAMTVRYLIIELSGIGMGLEGKKIMIPVGIASLHPQQDEIILPNIHIEQFIALPTYEQGQIEPGIERKIREVIGSPAALRIEETIAELDQENFYAHQHFDSEKFFARETNAPYVTSDNDQNETIRELIENSKENDLHAADEHTHHPDKQPHQIKPWLEPGAGHSQGGKTSNN